MSTKEVFGKLAFIPGKINHFFICQHCLVTYFGWITHHIGSSLFISTHLWTPQGRRVFSFISVLPELNIKPSIDDKKTDDWVEDWAALFKLAKLKLNLIAYAKREEVVGETVFSKVCHSNISHSTLFFFFFQCGLHPSLAAWWKLCPFLLKGVDLLECMDQ